MVFFLLLAVEHQAHGGNGQGPMMVGLRQAWRYLCKVAQSVESTKVLLKLWFAQEPGAMAAVEASLADDLVSAKSTGK
jgi:hypothetical protein